MVSRSEVRCLVEQYFDSFNAGNFEQTAMLFAQTGQLLPPFETAIAGQDNIGRYLEKKAKAMTAEPQHWTFHQEESGQWQIEVLGKVQTVVFQVNVTWQFAVVSAAQIDSVRIKLVASPKELLSLRASSGMADSGKDARATQSANLLMS